MIMSGKDLSLLCPKLVPDGLNLQVHGNRNSMMQIITYNPIDQDPFFFPFLLFTATTSTTTLGAYLLVSIDGACFSSQSHSDLLKSRIITRPQPKMHFIFYLW